MLGLVSQHVTPRRPERSHRPPDREVFLRRVPVDVFYVCNLANRRRIDSVNLAMRHFLWVGQPQLLREVVDARVLEELGAGRVDSGDGGVGLAAIRDRGEAAWEVFVGICVLEEATEYGVREVELMFVKYRNLATGGVWLSEEARSFTISSKFPLERAHPLTANSVEAINMATQQLRGTSFERDGYI